MAAKAARKATKEDLEKLTSRLELLKTYLNADELNWESNVEENSNFHLSLARLAGNMIFESVLSTFYENINKYHDQFLLKELWVLEKSYKDLCDITEAIREGNSDEAEFITRRHVRIFTQIMEERERVLYEDGKN